MLIFGTWKKWRETLKQKTLLHTYLIIIIISNYYIIMFDDCVVQKYLQLLYVLDMLYAFSEQYPQIVECNH